ncbi:MAG: hypothetical protein WBP93_17315 [Pyrinomonadaceae bacterium]
MKPLKSEAQDNQTLQELGRASVQIVHDLKNQLNGLKLYATFLRKRMEKSERPEDERETIAKLIAGLERAAGDMTILVRYGRPLELRRQPHVDLRKILNVIAAGEEARERIKLETENALVEGEFDSAAITEALKAITSGALNMRGAGNNAFALPLQIHLRRDESAFGPQALIKWRGVQSTNGSDPFQSFAGSDGLRLSLAAKIIKAHGGEVSNDAESLSVRLPLQ